MEHTHSADLVLADRYRLGELIGRGGMGKVWRAHDAVLHRTVAIKELTAGLYVAEADRTVLHARTQKEARAAARINHPGVVTVHDVIEYDDRPWIVMEYVDGPSLADVVKESGPLRPREAARIGLHVLGALHAAHAAGVLHRDVKPANILLARDGRVLITDFGIAAIEGDSEITRTGEIVGSIDYLAPERVYGEAPGPASDLWSLGATLYTAVEERSPFRRTSPIATLQAVVNDELPPLTRSGPLEPVITALLRKVPADRPAPVEAERMLLEAMEGRRPKQAQAYVPTQLLPDGMLREATATRRMPAPHPAFAEATGPVPADERGAGPFRAAGGRHSRLRSTALVMVLAVLIGAVVGFAAMKYKNRHGSSNENGTPTPASTGSTGKPGPNTGIPDGWHRVNDPEGFSLVVPDGWERQANGTGGIDYTPDDGNHFIRIGVDNDPDFATPYLHELALEPQLDRLPQYKRVTLHVNNFRDQDASLWEFTWTETKGHPGRRRAIDQMYAVDHGRAEYAIYMGGPADDWNRARFDTVLRYWQPPG